MDKNLCRQIDQESLVEQYVAGKLRGKLLEQFEQHIKDCEDHARAVSLEKALKRGVSEFARGEIKTKLRNRLKKREDSRFMILRYAAILFVAVITPLLLYYQLNVAPEEMAESVSEKEERVISDDAIDGYEEELQKADEPPKTELKARRSSLPNSEEEPIEPTARGGSVDKTPEKSARGPENARPFEARDNQEAESAQIQNMLKAVKATAPPKVEADYSLGEEPQAARDIARAPASRGDGQGEQSPALIAEINRKVAEDSSSIKGCMDNFLGESERIKYKLELSIQVLNNGKIGEIKIIRTTNQSSDLETCLLNIIKTWTLPDDVGEGTVVREITY